MWTLEILYKHHNDTNTDNHPSHPHQNLRQEKRRPHALGGRGYPQIRKTKPHFIKEALKHPHSGLNLCKNAVYSIHKPGLIYHFKPSPDGEKIAFLATTPTLFIHGELDNDTPICEAEQFFMVMKKMKQTARMVRYADDGHGIRKKPGNHLDSLRRTMAWFKQNV